MLCVPETILCLKITLFHSCSTKVTAWLSNYMYSVCFPPSLKGLLFLNVSFVFFTILHIHYVIISVYPKSMVCKETYKCVTYYSILIAVFSIFHIKMPAKGNMTKPSLYEHINLKAIWHS